MENVSHSTLGRGWPQGPAAPALDDGTVHVWRMDLDALPDGLQDLLSEPERARAARFRDRDQARRWGRAHGALRELLARYLADDPRGLSLAAGAFGKPQLKPARRGTAGSPEFPSFNISHSGPLALFGFSAAGEIGVDVEQAREQGNEVALAARAFGAEAAERLAGLDPSARPVEFLRAWTEHEAVLKCLGTGFGVQSTARNAPWRTGLDVWPLAAAAVAVERAPAAMCCWEYR